MLTSEAAARTSIVWVALSQVSNYDVDAATSSFVDKHGVITPEVRC